MIKELQISTARTNISKAVAIAKELDAKILNCIETKPKMQFLQLEVSARNLRDRLTLTDAAIGAAFLSLSEIAEISNQKLQTAIVEILKGTTRSTTANIPMLFLASILGSAFRITPGELALLLCRTVQPHQHPENQIQATLRDTRRYRPLGLTGSCWV